eukprot:SAG11_NODE_2105_length_3813_cov_2.468767_4_plen_166_part_00
MGAQPLQQNFLVSDRTDADRLQAGTGIYSCGIAEPHCGCTGDMGHRKIHAANLQVGRVQRRHQRRRDLVLAERVGLRHPRHSHPSRRRGTVSLHSLPRTYCGSPASASHAWTRSSLLPAPRPGCGALADGGAPNASRGGGSRSTVRAGVRCLIASRSGASGGAAL